MLLPSKSYPMSCNFRCPLKTPTLTRPLFPKTRLNLNPKPPYFPKTTALPLTTKLHSPLLCYDSINHDPKLPTQEEGELPPARIGDGANQGNDWSSSILLFGFWAGIMYYVFKLAPDQTPETMDPIPSHDYKNDELINAVEVREWENGKSKDDIAAKQGISIRRHPAKGLDSPRNILEKIIWDKVIEVVEMKKLNPLTVVKKAVEEAPPPRDFLGALKASYQRTGAPALIAEVKKASPSKGVLREDFDPVQIAKAYEQNGAACLSILTDEKYFQGSFENLEAVRQAGVKCPLLCKEFIIETWQIYYARAKGADAVLLIAAVLPDLDIKLMTMICKDLGLTALIEVHDEREMDRVLAIDGVELVGINNRNLGTFEVDISNTERLLEGERGEIICKKDIIVVGESGLFTPQDISYVQNAGVKAVLVGESLLKKSDPGKAIEGLFGKNISK